MQAARELVMDRFEATSGSVSVKLTREEKFPTKTNDPKGYNSIADLVRQFQLDTCLTLDVRALTELYLKDRLSSDQREKFSPFVQVVEGVRVSAKHKKPSEENGD